jgi:hypothetical protein
MSRILPCHPPVPGAALRAATSSTLSPNMSATTCSSHSKRAHGGCPSDVSHEDPRPVNDRPADDGRSFCNHRAMSTSSPMRLVLFDVEGTLVDHECAAAAGVEQWLVAIGWADAGTIASLVSEWDAIAE